MTEESTTSNNVVPFREWIGAEATRRKAFVLETTELEPGVDFKDFLYFLKKEPTFHPKDVFALQRKHFSGLGTKNPTVLVRTTGTETAKKRMLHLKAAKLVIKRIGREGDPEDYPFPGRYVHAGFVPWSRTAACSEEDKSAA